MVTIPGALEYGEFNSITIRATSQNDPEINHATQFEVEVAPNEGQTVLYLPVILK